MRLNTFSNFDMKLSSEYSLEELQTLAKDWSKLISRALFQAAKNRVTELCRQLRQTPLPRHIILRWKYYQHQVMRLFKVNKCSEHCLKEEPHCARCTLFRQLFLGKKKEDAFLRQVVKSIPENCAALETGYRNNIASQNFRYWAEESRRRWVRAREAFEISRQRQS